MSNITSSTYPVATEAKQNDQFAIVRNGQLYKVTLPGVKTETTKAAKEALRLGGPTSKRPTGQDNYTMFFDTTLNKPIWWDGTQWVDATGSVV